MTAIRKPHTSPAAASGGLERYFQNVDGVTDTTVGYAQSTVESPAYEQVWRGRHGAAKP